MQLKGLFTALITPFDKDGKLDERALRSNLQYQLKHKVDGIVLLGTTGESPTLTHEEKEKIIRIGAEEIKGKAKLIVGTGCYSTEQTIMQTKQAKSLGADAALVVIPYYNKPTQEGIYLHFKALHEAVDLPICVYNVQGRTAINLRTETLKRMALLQNIVSVKEASGNIGQIDEVIQVFAELKKPFTILSGDDGLTFSVLALGGHGVISVLSNLIPKPMRLMIEACNAGDYKTARHLHQQLSPLMRGMFIETNPIPVKAAMEQKNMPAGRCRLPLCDLEHENKEKLYSLIDKIPQEWFNH